MVVAILAMIGLVGVQLVAPAIIRQLVAAVESGVWDQGTMQFVLRLALVILAVYAGRAVLRFLSSYMAHVAGWNVVADVRRRIYEHLQGMSLRFY
jgi:ATP-binding cassette subfamily B protein